MLHRDTIPSGASRLPRPVTGFVALASGGLYWLGLKMADMRSASSGPPPGSLASIGSQPQAVLALQQGGTHGVANLHLLQGLVLIAISLGLGKAAGAGFRHIAAARRARAVRVHHVTCGMHVFSEEGRHDF